ncbi:MAG TPA: tyrosine-type recombinase/integrase [Bacteroidales bacterium]|nr:tyrosine-type recombinase/integrase [Bacteroidales bacterium]
MASIKFLTRSTINKPVTVYLRFILSRGVDYRVATSERIYPQYWSNKKQKINDAILKTDVFTAQDAADITERFFKLKDYILREYGKLSGQPVTREWLEKTVNAFYGTQKKGDHTPETLNQYIDRFIKEAKAGTRLTDKKSRFSYSYTHSLTGFQSQFNEYQGVYTEKALNALKEKKETPRKKHILNFGDINPDFYNEFIKYFYSKKYSPNTIGKHIKSLKTIMRTAKEEGLHNNTETERKAFKSISAPVQTIYLTESELQKIYNLNLNTLPDYDLARDVFLVGCYTAQRFSDFSRIKPENIRTLENGKKVIDLIQQKTGERVTIPIRHELETIMRKYNYHLPKTYEQKVNTKIKNIAADAGITDVIQIEKNKGGLRIKANVRKCDLVVTHTARRSGCTNMYLAGIPVIDIMKISGHKSEREFLKYIRVSKEETAIILSNHPYFIGNTLLVAK